MKLLWPLLSIGQVIAIGYLIGMLNERQTLEQDLEQGELRQREFAEKVQSEREQRLSSYLNLVKRVHHRSGEGVPGLSQSDMDVVITAGQFAQDSLDTQAFEDSPSLQGRTHTLRALTACLLSNWRMSLEAIDLGIGTLRAAAANTSDPSTLVDLCVALNLKCYIASICGDYEVAIQSANRVEEVWRASRAIRDVGLARLLAWEHTLALRSRAILAARLGQPATSLAQDSLQSARELYDGLPEDRGLYAWDLPHYLLDARQLVTFLYWFEENIEAARQSAKTAMAEFDELDQDIRRATAGLSQSMRMSKIGLLQESFNSLVSQGDADQDISASASQATVWPTLERRSGRTLHPDLLAKGRMPAEFERQAEIGFAWADSYWARDALASTIHSVSQAVPVWVSVENKVVQNDATRELLQRGAKLDDIRFEVNPSNSIWLRDFGPQFVLDPAGAPVVLDFHAGPTGFDFRLHNEYAAGRFADANGLPYVMPRVQLEGGHLLCNGDGLLLLSKSAILNNQISGISREHFFDVLKRLTGAKTIVPLDPLLGEPTQHIDVYAVFTGTNSVVVGSYRSEPAHPNAQLLDAIAAKLAGLPTSKGPLQVTRVPMPPPVNRWLGRTYTNVIFANNVLFVPSWDDVPPAIEQEALSVYQRLLPGWSIQTIPCDELGLRGGALRCLSSNFPAHPSPPSGARQESTSKSTH